MSWEEIKLAAVTMKNTRRWPVLMSSVRTHARTSVGRVYLTVRADEVPHGPLTWWRAGEKVTVKVGKEEHANILRIERGGSHVLAEFGRAGHRLSATLILPVLPGMVAQDQKITAVEFDYADGWLEVELPPWACRPIVQAPVNGAGRAVPDRRGTPFRIGQHA
jgi:hypothetical protein